MNYQLELEKLLKKLEGAEEIPHLLLHSCCAPCSSYCLEYLTEHFEITDFFFNPNIFPEEEYRKRSDELQRLISSMPLTNKVTFLEGRYDPSEFFEMAKGLEDIPEGGERCFRCYRQRLEEAAKTAAEINRRSAENPALGLRPVDYFTTTLSISPLKNAAKLNEIGFELAEKYGVKYLPSDFKKKGGYLRSIELSKQYDLYRQNFCGCVFSMREPDREAEALTMTD